MSIYSDAPPYREFKYDKPTLLVCWWITCFCTTMILLRVAGRWIRSEQLFREDKAVALSIIPMFARMVCVHFILMYGTNNANFDLVNLSPEQIHHRELGSKLVLASRIFYALTLWILKDTILEFLKRMSGGSWGRNHDHTLIAIRITLALTFIAILISDLAECQPFGHYWQVLPDPGPQCRQGHVQLITMAVCNVLTDLLLVLFPIPIIVTSHMSVKRKVQLVLLFSLSLIVVVFTIWRVPYIIKHHGMQQVRSLLASVELLFATFAANALVLGSFVRDRGVKKRKFRHGSAVDSMDRSSTSRSRRPTMNHQWGSDEDLVRDLGLGVAPELRERRDETSSFATFHPAPLAKPERIESLHTWQFHEGRRKSATGESDDPLLHRDTLTSSQSNSTGTPRKVSFFDDGAISGDGRRNSYRRSSSLSGGGDSAHSPVTGVPPSVPASALGVRRGSAALLHDLGGLLSAGPEISSKSPPPARPTSPPVASSSRTRQPPRHEDSYESGRHTGCDAILADPGGLLK